MAVRRYFLASLFASLFAASLLLFGGNGLLAKQARAADRPDEQRGRSASPAANYDCRLERFRTGIGASAEEKVAQNRGRVRLQSAARDLRVTWNVVTGTPRVVASLAGALAAADQQADPEELTRRFLRQHLDLFGISSDESDARHLRLSRSYTDRGTGVAHITLQQQYGGIEVYGGLIQAHFTASGELIKTGGELLPRVDDAINSLEPTVPASVAARAAAESVGVEIRSELYPAEEALGTSRLTRFARIPELRGETSARLQFLPLSRKAARLAWNILVSQSKTPDVYRILVDAETNEVLLRTNTTRYQSQPSSFRVFTSDSPTPFSPGSQAPEQLQPPFGSRELVTNFPDAIVSPNGWISDGGFTTTGNNADAYLDLDGNDQPDLGALQNSGRPVSASRTFDFPLNLSLPPTDSANQAGIVTQLFYLVNKYHDLLYELGFDEAAGNFQADNFGRGGSGGDPVLAEAQDSAEVGRRNNANFNPMEDGVPGRMQLYLWTGPDPDRDSDLDAEVVFHELTHGLSARLIGGPSAVGTLDQLQSEGLSEGWSDFFALALLSEPGEDPDGAYPFGAYVAKQFAKQTFLDNYYFGIRRYPYSTDLNKNPLTFQMISDKLRPNTAATPRSPVATDLSDEAHAEGEVWCSALWECRANLIRQYGFEDGNRIVLQLAVDGLKFSPPNPNFIEARDAILIADRVRNGGVNECALWAAFAKRGMGVSASSPPAEQVQGVTESFDVPPECAGPRVIAAEVDDSLGGNSNHQLDPGETDVAINLRAENNTLAPLSITQAVVSTTAEGITLTSPSAVFPTIAPSGGRAQTTQPFKVSVSSSRPCGLIQLRLSLTSNQGNFQVPFSIAIGVNVIGETETLFSDSVDTGANGWTAQTPWGITTSSSNSPPNSWTDSPGTTYQNLINTSLTSPAVDLTDYRDVSVSFSHRYSFEDGFDTGSVEVSADDGKSWQRIVSYTGVQPAFVTATAGASALEGASRARIRFHVSTDTFVSSDGWYVDDIVIRARRITPECAGENLAPAADDLSISVQRNSTKNPLMLSGSDPEGKPLKFTIASSPAHGSLSGTAPSMRYTPDGAYAGPDSFTYSVSDGVLVSKPAAVSIAVSTPAPAIISVKPSHARVGQMITIKGANFFATEMITFDTAVQRTITTNAKGKKITAAVPAGAVSGMMTVVTFSGRVSVPFTVDP